jgi:hypothetical protein
MTDEQFERYALEVLKRELGLDGLARFLRLHRSGTGDYTPDRIQWHKGDLSVDEIVESIRWYRRVLASLAGVSIRPVSQATARGRHRVPRCAPSVIGLYQQISCESLMYSLGNTGQAERLADCLVEARNSA